MGKNGFRTDEHLDFCPTSEICSRKAATTEVADAQLSITFITVSALFCFSQFNLLIINKIIYHD